MIKQALLSEFQHEAEGTRKLLSMIPDSALSYRPQPHLWSIAELASHIAEIYNWYEITFNQDSFEISSYKYDKGDISKASNILEKFEANLKVAEKAIEKSEESEYMNNWIMTSNGKATIAGLPKIQVIRGYLFNHLYHHRGELISHLRATGNKVPSLFGPNYEESQEMIQ